jgi:peroxiredoxin/outer membrane lipoprotein-sorting protein
MPAVARAVLLASLALAGAGAVARADVPADPTGLLTKVRETYQGLTRCRFEGVVSVSMSAQGQQQSFDSPVMLAVSKPGRIRSEIRNPMMGMQYVSDGQEMVVYAEQLNQFTRRPLPVSADSLVAFVPSALNRYFTIDEKVKSARRVRDERLIVAGKPVDCVVVEVDYDHPTSPQGELSATTFWIDRARALVVRESLMVIASNPQTGGTMEISQSTLITVSDTEVPQPDSLFVFRAPAGATEVQQIGQQAPRPDLSGKPAPDFTLTDLAGRPVKLSGLRGKVVLLDFWATWCGPCRIEMPRVQKLYKDFKSRGLEVFGVDFGEDPARVKPFIQKNGYTFPILLDRKQQVGRSYEVNGIPTLVIVDRKGIIHSYFVGVREDKVLRNSLAELGIK